MQCNVSDGGARRRGKFAFWISTSMALKYIHHHDEAMERSLLGSRSSIRSPMVEIRFEMSFPFGRKRHGIDATMWLISPTQP